MRGGKCVCVARGALLAAVLVLGAVILGQPAVAAVPARQDAATMSPAEITALQRRLSDARCYAGAADGKASEALRQAIAACPDQRPLLRIETGMHTAPIRRIGADAACWLGATASDDKTVRLWSLPEGRLLRTLRLPVGAGNGGKVYATALSPDGRFVAAGGWDARFEIDSKMAVTIFDAATGGVVARAGAFGNLISRLVFSPDGRWLAVTLAGGQGLRVIEIASWRVVASDTAYGSDSYGAAFAPDGRLYTVAFDGKIRRYGPGPGFRKEAEVSTRGGKRPSSIAIDPKGERLAVVFNDIAAVDLYDAPSLSFRSAADTKGIDNGILSSVAWRGDGQALLTGGMYHKSGKFPVLLFDRDGHRQGEAIPVATGTIEDLQHCGDGFAIAADDPAFGLLDARGQPQLWRAGATADMRGKRGTAFTVAADGRRLRFGLGVGAAQPVLFDLRQAVVTDSPGAVAGWAEPLTTGLPVTDWQSRPDPRFGGQPIKLYPYELSRSVAVRPAHDGFVLGAEYLLRAFDAQGRERWNHPVPGVAWGVNLADQGRLILAAYGDGTIRWHRWSDGAELLALFVHKDSKAWVAWTPSGYYTASPGGEDLIGWHLNRGWEQAAEFFPAAQFREQFARPDIVERVLDTQDEAEAIRLANAARPVRPATPVIEQLPPQVSILSPADGSTVNGTEVRINYLVRSPSDLAVDTVEALVEGKPVGDARGLGRNAGTLKECLEATHGLGRREGALQGCRGSVTVSLPPGPSQVSVFARAGSKTSEVVSMRVTRTVPAAPIEVLKPKLYALVVGVSSYAAPYALKFPAKDAADFAAALVNQKGGLYGEVTVRLLTDQQASAVAIKDGLDWLTHEVTSRDVGIVYLAGHGDVDPTNRFYFLAADTDPQRLRATAVPNDDIIAALNTLSGKALLFLDACHAGAVTVATADRRSTFDFNNVLNEFKAIPRGLFTFAASSGRQVSLENAAWNNGAFTKAVVEGLGQNGQPAKADYDHDGVITAKELDLYVAQRVKELTGGQQSPGMTPPRDSPNLPLALVR